MSKHHSLKSLALITALSSSLLPLAAHAQTGMIDLKGAAMPITLVYPTAAVAPVQMLGPFQIKAALGAPPAKGNGRLIILSHGNGGSAIASLIRHCGTNPKADAGFCLYGLRTAEEREKRAQSYAVTSNLPASLETLEPAERDARVAAVALSVPVAGIFTDASLAAIRIPVGVIEATDDDVLLPRFHSSRLLKACGGCKSLDVLTGANHFDVLSPWPQAIGQQMSGLGGGAYQSKFDRTRLPASYQRIATFFEQTLLTTP